MPDLDEIELPENTKISLNIPHNTGQVTIEILVNGKVYAVAQIAEATTGEFDFGILSYSKKKKRMSLLGKFPFKLNSFDINTGVFKAHFDRKK